VDGRAVARTAVTRLERQRSVESVGAGAGSSAGSWCLLRGVSSIDEASESLCHHHRSSHRCGQDARSDRHLSSLAATGLHEWAAVALAISRATCCFSLEAGPHEIARKLQGAKASTISVLSAPGASAPIACRRYLRGPRQNIQTDQARLQHSGSEQHRERDPVLLRRPVGHWRS
jgi:hypothetical protein